MFKDILGQTQSTSLESILAFCGEQYWLEKICRSSLLILHPGRCYSSKQGKHGNVLLCLHWQQRIAAFLKRNGLLSSHEMDI